MHDNWLRMLQDDEPPKSSWKPRKSTKSWDQLSVHNLTKSHTVTEKGPSRGKMVLPSLVAWRACTKIRDAPAEKRRESKVRRSSTRTEMLFLWCFSAPYRERILAASGAHCTILSHIMLFWTYGIDHSYEARVKCKIGYDGGPITWISAKPTDWTPEVNYYISWKNGRTFGIPRRISCSSLSRVLSTRSSCSTSPTSPTSLSKDHEFLFCVQQQYEVRIWVNKHEETCHKPSHRTTNKHGETRYRLNCHEEKM